MTYNYRFSKYDLAVFTLSLMIFLWSACGVPTTSSCPNCVNNKPVYYNKEKARDARRLAKQAHKQSAVGGQTLPDPYGTEKKGIKPKKKKGSKDVLLGNEPIL